VCQKRIFSCDTTSCEARTEGPADIMPGDVLQYVVRVSNIRDGPMQGVMIRDHVPQGTVLVGLEGWRPATSWGLLFSTAQGASGSGLAWSAVPPSELASSTSPTSGPFVYLAPDGDGTISTGNGLQPGGEFELRLTVWIPDGGPAPGPAELAT